MRDTRGVTARAEGTTGLRACAEWYFVYGPGYANMGGSDGRMLVDFFVYKYGIHLTLALGHGRDFDTDDMAVRMPSSICFVCQPERHSTTADTRRSHLQAEAGAYRCSQP